jgi:hypothetical protein
MHERIEFVFDELMGFIEINFCKGYHFSDTIGVLHKKVISEVMNRDRFSKMLLNIHVHDNIAIPVNNKDKLYKLCPMIR